MSIYPENVLVMAPLSGYTDLPYRQSMRRCGCRFAFAEMIDAASLAYSPERALAMLRRGGDEDFLGVQLVGSDPEQLKTACGRLAGVEASVLDFNLGCPVPKVTKKQAGAALGRHIEKALQCFRVLKEYTGFRVTAKIRIVSEQDPEPTLDLVRGLTECGAEAITIHARTLEGFYTGTLHPEYIAMAHEAVPNQEIIANGGVKDLASYRWLREKSGVSRVMLAQGAMGNPWLFRILTGGANPTLSEWKEMILTHIREMCGLYGEASAMRQSRKIVHHYLKARGIPTLFRDRASYLTEYRQLEEMLTQVTFSGGPVPRPFDNSSNWV